MLRPRRHRPRRTPGEQTGQGSNDLHLQGRLCPGRPCQHRRLPEADESHRRNLRNDRHPRQRRRHDRSRVAVGHHPGGLRPDHERQHEGSLLSDAGCRADHGAPERRGVDRQHLVDGVLRVDADALRLRDVEGGPQRGHEKRRLLADVVEDPCQRPGHRVDGHPRRGRHPAPAAQSEWRRKLEGTRRAQPALWPIAPTRRGGPVHRLLCQRRIGDDDRVRRRFRSIGLRGRQRTRSATQGRVGEGQGDDIFV
mmetsp:Transcript_30201/g.64744  ORF Transcript_30201/g.64744 Transcript_30201/m.64744 type:complete len:252 (-) Transcript_30201:944-1699(-)